MAYPTNRLTNRFVRYSWLPSDRRHEERVYDPAFSRGVPISASWCCLLDVVIFLSWETMYVCNQMHGSHSCKDVYMILFGAPVFQNKAILCATCPIISLSPCTAVWRRVCVGSTFMCLGILLLQGTIEQQQRTTAFRTIRKRYFQVECRGHDQRISSWSLPSTTWVIITRSNLAENKYFQLNVSLFTLSSAFKSWFHKAETSPHDFQRRRSLTLEHNEGDSGLLYLPRAW